MERLILAETDDCTDPDRNFAKRKCAMQALAYADIIALDLRAFSARLHRHCFERNRVITHVRLNANANLIGKTHQMVEMHVARVDAALKAT